MIHSNPLAILFALASALSIAWGTVLRHQTADEFAHGVRKSRAALQDGSRDVSGAAPQAVRTSFPGSGVLASVLQLKWWGGLALSFLGYGLQIVALGFGTLLVVQPVLVLSLMFTLPLSAKLAGRRISKSEMSWAALLTVAVAVLVLLGRPLPGIGLPPLPKWLVAAGVGVVIFAVLIVFSYRFGRANRALILGLVTGGIMGYVAVLSKAVVDIFAGEGAVFAVVLHWELYALIGAAVIGTAVQQAAFNAGELKDSLPAMTVAEPLFAFPLGYFILGEKFQVGGTQWIWMALALLVMMVSTVILSRKSITD